ncbi:GroES-like protein [Xylaria nigripes]|nr:GroES-like protein [Xylaria nigripes]
MPHTTTESLPHKQQAIVAGKDGALVFTNDAPLPNLGPHRILVKTMAVSVNPADLKFTGRMTSIGATSGCDFAGIVVAIGSGIPQGKFSLGDRVAGVVPGMNSLSPDNGAFAEYVCGLADFIWLLPETMPFETGATLGISTLITGYALFQSLQLPGYPDNPTSKPEYVLVYGGSSATGTMMIQMLRKSGFIPIATCSPRNFQLLKEYGAEEAFDYHEPDSPETIRSYTKNALWYVVDCHCDGSSMEFCYKAIGRAGGKYTTLEPYHERLHTRKAIEPKFVLAAALLGENVGWKPPYNLKADPELHSFGVAWSSCIQRMLKSGGIKTHPVRLHTGTGVGQILEGIATLKEHGLSGEKLVIRIMDT